MVLREAFTTSTRIYSQHAPDDWLGATALPCRDVVDIARHATQPNSKLQMRGRLIDMCHLPSLTAIEVSALHKEVRDDNSITYRQFSSTHAHSKSRDYE